MGQPMLEVHPDWERAAELGISPGDLGYTVWAYSDGAYVDEFFLDDDEIDIFLYSTTGNIERPQDLERLMLYSLAVALLIAYLLMVAVFSHWGYPLLILTSVPIGVSGGIAGLYLLNLGGGHLDKFGIYPIQQPFDMLTMLGFLVLIGTVVNNPILIVERAVTNLRERSMDVLDAVTEAVRIRLRPVMMSMVTTVAGLSPLVFNPGAGTELYRGLGAIVLFGLLFSTLVTLTFMPALLSLVLRVANHLGQDRSRAQNAQASSNV